MPRRRWKIQSLASLSIAALTASGLSLVGSPLIAHAANETCAQLATDLPGATNGAVFTLSDNHLCTQAYVIPTGVQVTIQGADNTQGFDGQNGHLILGGADNGATVIQNLIFKNGQHSGPVVGGAIDLTGTVTPQLLGDTFLHNHADGNGGGAAIISTATSGTILVSGCVFGSTTDATQGNTASARGGGLDISAQTSVSLTNNTFANNVADGGGGAYITINSMGATATLTVTGNQFIANSAAGDGGGASVQTRDPVQSVFSNNVFRQNRLTLANNRGGGHRGGGLFLGYPPLFLMAVPTAVVQTQNVFDSNVIESVMGVDPPSAQPRVFIGFDYGGGGEWVSDVQLTSTRDRFINNAVMASDPTFQATPTGGGLGVEATIRNVSVRGSDLVAAGNSVGAGGTGGGIYAGIFQAVSSNVQLFDSTVAGNVVGSGGTFPAISAEALDTLALTNTIAAANTGGDAQVGGFGTMSATFSDVCGAGGAVPAGTGNICRDPKLVNPGPGQADVHETSVSPTIDAGSTALVPGGLTVDYEGDPRVSGPAVDIGADEFEPPTPTLPLAGSPGPPAGVPTWSIAGLGLLALLGAGLAARSRRRQV